MTIKCTDWERDPSGQACKNYMKSANGKPGLCKLHTRYQCEEWQRQRGLPVDSLIRPGRKEKDPSQESVSQKRPDFIGKPIPDSLSGSGYGSGSGSGSGSDSVYYGINAKERDAAPRLGSPSPCVSKSRKTEDPDETGSRHGSGLGRDGALRGRALDSELPEAVSPAWVSEAVDGGLLIELQSDSGRYRVVPSHAGPNELTHGEAAFICEILRIFPGARLEAVRRRGDAWEPPTVEDAADVDSDR